MARATGRRIGRIYGALDDLLTLCEAYQASEGDLTDADREAKSRLGELQNSLFGALLQAEQLASFLNQRYARAGREALPPPPEVP